MKKVLEFAGLISLGLAVIGFILMMATPSVALVNGNNASYLNGVEGIFGNEDITAPWAGLTAWIFLLVSILAGVVLFVLPLLKIDLLGKFADICSLVVCVLLVLAGVFLFCEAGAYQAAIGSTATAVVGAFGSIVVGAGWIIGGILLIVAGCAAGLPAVLRLLGKK